MSWGIVYRVVVALLTLSGLFCGVVIAAQNTGLAPTVLVWLGIWVAFSQAALAVLPSLAGVSSVAPKSETAVLADARAEGMRRALTGRAPPNGPRPPAEGG